MDNDIQATLSKMREDFITRLPDRLETLKALLSDLECGQPESLETMHRTAHSLVGAAGVHQLMLVSQAARELERILAAIPADGMLQEQGLVVIRQALAELEMQVAKPHYGLIAEAPKVRSEIPRIVVVDDDEEQAGWLRNVLEQAGYRVDVFHELAAFSVACGQSEPPAAVIMDMMFPEGEDAGAQVIAKLKEQTLNSFPVIFTSVRQDMSSKLAAYRSGATCYLTKPLDAEALLRVVGESVALTPSEPFRVLLVDDDLDQLAAHALILRQAGMTVLETDKPMQVPKILEEYAPEILVLDMYMPECSGPELANVLRDDQHHAKTPIVYLSAETCVSRQLLAMNRGGDHFLTKPVDPRHLVAAVALHARRFRQEQEQAESQRSTLYERERQQQALDAHAIVSVADNKGNIIYVNDKFCEVSGYSRAELTGQNHRLVKSTEHSPEFYRDMWRTIAQGKIWRGEVCNRSKDGNLYWVESSIVPFLDANGRPYQYVSIRTDISHIKKTEQTLRIMERAIEASSSCFMIADAGVADNPLIYVNPAFERVTGYRRTEVIGRNARFLQGENTRQKGLDEIRALIHEGRAGDALVYNYRKDGSAYWNDLRIAPVHDENGRLSHFIGISDDVTERREAGDALRQSEDRLRRSQLYANIGTWDWNIQTGQLICSENINSMFGNPENQDSSYKDFLNNVHPDDRQQVLDAINACVEQGAEFNIEFRCLWPDGTERWLLERGDVLRDGDGAPLNMLGVVQDITKRKLVELKMLEQQEKLLISKHTIHNVADGVVTIDPTGIIRSFNPAAEKLFGYSASEAIGCNVKLLMPEPYCSEHDQYLARHNAGQSAGIIGKQVELVGRHKDGTVFPMELVITAMEMDGKKHFVGIMRNISERKQHEQELVAARDEAEQANKAKSEFLSSMSHELRTPMNAILGFGQLLEIDDDLTEEQADYVDEMLKAGRHLLELINEVLDLARIESGAFNLSIEVLPCSEILAECLALVGPIAKDKNITINDTAINNYKVRADRTRLKQVIINLLSNAIKYNRPQGEVSIHVDVRGERVRLAVSDTGYGIPESRQQELFQPFSRLGAEDTAIEGTGIGLTISRRLVEKMGGIIDVESEAGKGSTFWLELPAGETEPGALNDDRENQATEAGAAQEDECRYTVLYIEDNPANLRLVTQILARNKQLNLITAHTPELGLELASARRPDLILLDINLPGMDGYQVLSVLKTMASVKNIPVIAISANAMPSDIERGMAAGFDDYITKPIDVTHFQEVVYRLLCFPTAR